MLTGLVYHYVSLVIWTIFLIFLGLLVLRLIFSYSDPNPFGKIGRFSFKIRKMTERFVYPAARLLANFKIDTRLAPIVTMLMAGAITYFALQIIGGYFVVWAKG